MKPPKPHDLKKLPVTKLEAARRQLETAITLWFHDVDPVSVHTLVMAAHGILKPINKKRGGRPMAFDEPPPYVRPEFQTRVARMFVEASNFFKHGASDPLATHYFAPEFNQFMILDGCQTFQELAHEKRPLMTTFIAYSVHHNPDLFEEEARAVLQRNELMFNTAKQWSKTEFFAEYLPTASLVCANAATETNSGQASSAHT